MINTQENNRDKEKGKDGQSQEKNKTTVLR